MIVAAMSIVGILRGIGDLNEKVVNSISNATTVISAGISGISQLPDSIVGAFGILLYILVFGLQARVIYSKYCTRNSVKFHLGSETQEQEQDQAQEPSPGTTLENRQTGKMDRDKVSRDIETRHLLYRYPHLKRPPVTSIRSIEDDPISPTYKIW